MIPEDPTSGTRSRQSSGSWTPPSVNEMQQLLPQYDILELLGRGGMGAVYKARQKSLNRVVAIKILPVEFADDPLNFALRFKQEAQTIAQLNHPGIVSVYDFGETSGGRLWFAMEFVDGTDVAKMMGDAGMLPLESALHIMQGVCAALDYAHRHDVIHRDIKPANILVNKDGEVKVADFGLAKAGDQALHTALTRTNVAIGTQEFAAPEMLTPGTVVDHRADIYSLGVMLYQMLTGEIPRVMFKLPSRRRPELGRRFDAVICKALETDPQDRYQSVLDFRRDLDAAVATPNEKVSEMLPQRGKRMPAFIAVVAGVALVAGAALLWKGANKDGDKSAAGPGLKTSTMEPGGVKLWDTPDKVAHVPAAKWEKNALRLDGKGAYTGVQVRDMVLRAEILMNPDRESPAIVVRRRPAETNASSAHGDDAHYYGLTANAGGTLSLHSVHPSSRTLLGEWSLSRPYGPDEWLPVELRAVDNDITVSAEGKVLGKVHDTSQPGTGLVMVWARSKGYFRNIVYVPFEKPTVVSSLPHEDASRADAIAWTDWLGPKRRRPGSLPSTWINKPDGVTTEKEITGEQIFPLGTFDAAVRLTYVLGDAKGIMIVLHERGANDSRENYNIEDNAIQCTVKAFGPNGIYRSLAKHVHPDGLDPAAERTLEVRATGDLLTVSVNGVVAASVHDATLPAGPCAVVLQKGVLVKKIETWTPDDVAATALPLTGPVEHLGHRYQLVPGARSWPEASASAKSMGGHLAKIDTEEKLNWVIMRFGHKALAEQSRSFWVDGLRASVAGPWQWYDGTPADAISKLPETALTVGTVAASGSFPAYLSLDHFRTKFHLEDQSEGALPVSHWKKENVGFLVEWDSPKPAGKIVDLLKFVDVKRDAIEGDWTRTTGGLAVKSAAPASNGASRLQLPYEPPAEYDFEIEFTAVEGTGDLKQVLSEAGRSFNWCLDTGLNGGRKAGFEMIDGLTIKNRADGTIMRAHLLTNGERHRSRVEVRKGSLRGYLDDIKLVDWGGPVTRLDVPEHSKMRDSVHLGLSTWSRGVTFHKIEVREVTGTGKMDGFP